jgi:hypothetical protein
VSQIFGQRAAPFDVGTHDPRRRLIGTALAALAVYYFIGVDEGAVSVFGKSMMIHEFVHDSRHFLGFPCH